MDPSQTSAIEHITNWVDWLLLIIPAGAGVMVMYQAIRKATTFDESISNDCSARIRNIIKGAVIAFGISGFISIARRIFNI